MVVSMRSDTPVIMELDRMQASFLVTIKEEIRCVGTNDDLLLSPISDADREELLCDISSCLYGPEGQSNSNPRSPTVRRSHAVADGGCLSGWNRTARVPHVHERQKNRLYLVSWRKGVRLVLFPLDSGLFNERRASLRRSLPRGANRSTCETAAMHPGQRETNLELQN